VNNEELYFLMLLTGEMSHDHSKKGFKTKSLTRMLRDATQNWEVPKTKNGTNLHKQKKFVKIWRLVLHDAAEELSLIMDKL